MRYLTTTPMERGGEKRKRNPAQFRDYLSDKKFMEETKEGGEMKKEIDMNDHGGELSV